jgi:hypothetical protein
MSIRFGKAFKMVIEAAPPNCFIGLTLQHSPILPRIAKSTKKLPGSFAQRYLSATRDPRKVTADVHAQYFGTELNDRSLVPRDKARLGPTHFADWLSRSTAQKAA